MSNGLTLGSLNVDDDTFLGEKANFIGASAVLEILHGDVISEFFGSEQQLNVLLLNAIAVLELALDVKHIVNGEHLASEVVTLDGADVHDHALVCS